MLIEYARTSTTEQVAGIEAQERGLLANGCERIFREQTSSVGTRTQFELAMSFMREGDVLVVTKLDRLARSVADLCSIVSQLEKKGIALRILGLGMDTSTPSGKLMLNLLGSSHNLNVRSCSNAREKALPKPRAKASTKEEPLQPEQRPQRLKLWPLRASPVRRLLTNFTLEWRPSIAS